MTGTQAVPSLVNFPCINPPRRAGPQEESNELSAAAVRSNEQSDNRTRARARSTVPQNGRDREHESRAKRPLY